MLQIINSFVTNLISRISTVMSICIVGSRVIKKDEETSSDLDIIVLIDDSEKLDKNYTTQVIKKIGNMINPIIHCQVFYLTEFWNYVINGSPITFTMLRDATVYYDTGFFENLKKLVKMGIIRPKTEAVEKQLSIAKQLMKITYHSVNKGLIQNLEGAIVSSTQSLLMEMGIEPPRPKEVPIYIKKYLVDRNLIPDEYYSIARRVIQNYKDIEHNKRAHLSGKELQDLYNDTNRFVTKVEEIISRVRKQ